MPLAFDCRPVEEYVTWSLRMFGTGQFLFRVTFANLCSWREASACGAQALCVLLARANLLVLHAFARPAVSAVLCLCKLCCASLLNVVLLAFVQMQASSCSR